MTTVEDRVAESLGASPGLDPETKAYAPAPTAASPLRRRGWVVRRTLMGADLVGLLAAYLIAERVFGPDSSDRVRPAWEFLIFVCLLPVWIIGFHFAGLYDHDDERTDHSTADDFIGTFNVVTVGTWVASSVSWLTHFVGPNPPRMVLFWGLAVLLVTLTRAGARTLVRRSPAYIQNTIIVGAGEVGQLIARKLLMHPEYRINLVGFIDDQPRERREDLEHLTIVGQPEQLPQLVRLLDVERVIIAFWNKSHTETLQLVRSLKALDVQIDVVPRLFEIVGSKVGIHSVEGLPFIGLPPTRLSPLAFAIKRGIDIIVSALLLVAVAPLLIYIALRVKRDSPGPVFFKQTRLGMGMREFTTLKFRTMQVGIDDEQHREYIRRIMDPRAVAGSNGLYKLQREDVVTPFGRWLRKSSLDELPQLINVLRGDMSLVGPRPCIPYETEHFAEHQFERFMVPAGMTGLWQVTARANATFGEALEMDVSYARGWSLALDLRLLLRTPRAVFRLGGTV